MVRAPRFNPVGSSHSPHQRSRRTGGTWTQEEDERLSQLVSIFGEKAWVKVAEGFNNTRDKKQCRERWCNHVNPAINESPFTAEENIFIIKYYIRYGRQWANMSRTKELHGRPDNAIKNHFNTNLLSHYLEICQEHNIPQNTPNSVDSIKPDVSLDVLRAKVTAPITIPSKGVKASRFLSAFPCKSVESVETTPKTLSERRSETRNHESSMHEIHKSQTHLMIQRASPLSVKLYSSSQPTECKTAPLEGSHMLSHYGSIRHGFTSRWSRPQKRALRSPSDENTDYWSGSEYSIASPPISHAHHDYRSPSTFSDVSLTEVDDQRFSQHMSRWVNSNGYFSLPPLNSCPNRSSTTALFSRLSCHPTVDEQQKALLIPIVNRRGSAW